MRRRTDDRAEEGVAGRVRLALCGRRHRTHDAAIGMMRSDPLLARDDDRGGAIVSRARHHRREGLRDHPRREHFVGGDEVVGLAVRQRVERAVVPVLGCDLGEGFGRRAVLVHPALRPHREERRGQDGRVELVASRAAGCGTARDACRGHVGHLVEAQRHRHLRASRGDRPRGLPVGEESGGGRVLDVRDGKARKAELLHGLDAHLVGRPR